MSEWGQKLRSGKRIVSVDAGFRSVAKAAKIKYLISRSERSAARLAHRSGGPGVGSSNLPAPTILQGLAEETETATELQPGPIEETQMKYGLASIACLFLFGATPASAAPQWVEDLCWYHANRVLPALNAREREAYIANCLADYTAGSPPPPRSSKNTDRNRY